MAITDAWLRARHGKPYDGDPEFMHRDGVGVRISPKGKISWIYRCYYQKKQIRMKIGSYPNMKMSDAMRERDKRFAILQAGKDPRLVHHIEKPSLPQTVNELIEYWIENHAQHSIKRWPMFKTMFENDITPHIGDFSIHELELSDCMPVFRKARERVGPKHSANLMSRFKQVLSFGVREGIIKYNVLSELKKKDVGEPTAIKRTKQDKTASPVLFQAISNLKIHESNKNFLRLMVIFANRSNELRLAKKVDFDLNKRVWTVPEENNKIRKKGGGDIVRAIPDLAAEVINNQLHIWPDSEYLFPPVNKEQTRPMAANVPVGFGARLADEMERLGYPRTTNHDMRRTARNIWESLGIPHNVAEVMLGHKVHTGVQSHYLDYNYLDEQREAYEKWCVILKG
ncbi:MAG: tyrosine-type recombinase/integrase [Vibrio sp.]|uniref:tyrosine-type recombinase/integrase n=1 Tax=Vibrio sp. TaxID=678 RepID=UPI003A8C4DB8